MTEEQDKMAKRFSTFISHLTGLDWQLGIITTDAHEGRHDWQDGKLVPFKGLVDTHIINAQTPNVFKVFAETVHRREWGSDDEEGIRNLYKVFNRPENRPMVRQHSLVASIIVSDEDERSDGTKLRPENTPEKLVATFKEKFGATNSYVNHSIIYHNGDDKSPKCPQVGEHYFGAHYAKLSEMTGGVTGDICAEDYGDALKSIGDALQKATFTVMLKCAPTGGKVQLSYTPQPPNSITYTLDGGKMTLAPYPPIGTKVAATYYCD